MQSQADYARQVARKWRRQVERDAVTKARRLEASFKRDCAQSFELKVPTRRQMKSKSMNHKTARSWKSSQPHGFSNFRSVA